MRTAAFLAIQGACHGDQRLLKQIFQFQGFDQVGVPDQGMIGDPHILEAFGDFRQFDQAFLHYCFGAEYACMVLHGSLHGQTDMGRRR